MAKYTVAGASLVGCAVTLGEHKQCIDDTPELYGNNREQLERLKTIIGIDERYTAAEGTTAADLCTHAAKRLMHSLHVSLFDLGALVFVTQTPDYLMPGNAHIMHGMLGLSTETPALDISMGCSGYVYALWVASMIAASGGKPVLLAAGDTLSKKTGQYDKATRPLFGDAGSASLVVPAVTEKMHFVLHSNGSLAQTMFIPAGGARVPTNAATCVETAREEGVLRSQEQIFMDGFGIFSFTMTEQPKLLQEILAYSDKNLQQIDYVVMHQANRYIVTTIAKKCGLSAEKVPADIFSQFGNQNSASIPGVLCGALANQLRTQRAEVVLQGFGVGLSWGACQLALNACLCLPPLSFNGEVKISEGTR